MNPRGIRCDDVELVPVQLHGNDWVWECNQCEMVFVPWDDGKTNIDEPVATCET